MEKKTIGSFIAALRRANGMTQRELAEKLNVSDKAVSRWERDECAPDLLLIPVIADIFGVTSDELLRGQRASTTVVEDKAETNDNERYMRERSDKAIRAILIKKQSDYFTVNLVVYLCVALGIIGAMIADLAFIRAYVGFFIDLAFTVGAVFVLALGTRTQTVSLDADDFDGEILNEYKKYIEKTVIRSITVIACGISFCVPLMFVGNAYFGLPLIAWLLYGAIFVIIAFALCKLIAILTFNKRASSGFYTVTEEEIEKNLGTKKALKLFGKRFCIITLIFAAIITVFNIFMAANDYFAGKTFDTFEEAKEYIDYLETQPSSYGFTGNEYIDIPSDVTILEEPVEGSIDYSDDAIHEELFEKYLGYAIEIRNSKAEVVARLFDPKNTVMSWSYENENTTCLPITLISGAIYHRNRTITSLITTVLIVLYSAALIITAWSCSKERY